MINKDCNPEALLPALLHVAMFPSPRFLLRLPLPPAVKASGGLHAPWSSAAPSLSPSELPAWHVPTWNKTRSGLLSNWSTLRVMDT